MNVISLTSVDLSIAAFLVVSLAILSIRMKLGLTRQIIVAGIRTTVQLLLIGLVLKALFDHMNIIWIMLISFIMLIAAGREVMSRQKRKFSGLWGFGAGTVSMFISSFSITVLALTVVIDITPWYEPQYAIPLLGMMLGNTMNGIAV
ncbi:MAG: ABC transporter permease, partial [Deltaproteobacteria bacterium]|nr:ABC transporter permease [Deltaproteobacteria bacterium]